MLLVYKSKPQTEEGQGGGEAEPSGPTAAWVGPALGS